VRRAVVGASLLGWLALAPASCRSAGGDDAGAPKRSCALTVWHRAASASAYVEVVGDWDGWARGAHVLGAERDDGWRAASFDLAPGEHTYAIVEDGAWLTDANVATTAFHDGNEVSWVRVDDCALPALRVDEAHGSADGEAQIGATFLAARDGAAIDSASVIAIARDGTALSAPIDVDPRAGTIALHATSLAPGKHTLTLRAKDTRGRAADDARATVWIEPAPFDPRDIVMYQVMVDRYRDESGALAAPSPASARAGGNVDGVRKAIESGELAAMGINTIWLSPLYKNPDGMFPGSGGHEYSSYHGYWPIESRALDPRVASESSLDALVAAAHARGMRVLFDVVPNHVHEQHPYFRAHAGEGWFNHADGGCVCGAPSCDWATHIEDCWFAPYLPDLDWRRADVADQITSDVLWWIDRFDGDGLRIDAVPMMPRAATRRIAAAVRAKYDHPGHQSFLLGETFTGPAGFSSIRYELGPFGLDSEFHFPLMWSLRRAIAEESAPLTDLDDTIRQGDDAWRGSGAVMTTMIGNHDVARFASVSAGDGAGDGWTPASQPPDESAVHAKQAMAIGLVMTLPGAPVVYYGDEVALVGHADPDSRRVLPSDADLTPAQRRVRDLVRTLGLARACSPALRRGTYRTLFADAEHLVFARELAGADPAIVVVTRSDSAPAGAPFATAMPQIPAQDYVDSLSGSVASLRPELTNLTTGPLSLQLFFPKGSACARRP
jgi:glycosidase